MHLRTELLLEALNIALWRRGLGRHSPLRPGSAAHLDRIRSAMQGRWRAPLDGIVGDCNALCENFATVECELLDRSSFRTQTDHQPSAELG
jgi:hypothetical protein